MKYSTTTNLFSNYPLPTGEARYEFARFRERATAMTTRDLYSVYISNRNAVNDYHSQASLQFYCIGAAARRDFCAALLSMRGLKFDHATNDFPNA